MGWQWPFMQWLQRHFDFDSNVFRRRSRMKVELLRTGVKRRRIEVVTDALTDVTHLVSQQSHWPVYLFTPQSVRAVSPNSWLRLFDDGVHKNEHVNLTTITIITIIIIELS